MPATMQTYVHEMEDDNFYVFLQETIFYVKYGSN
jgi:hypothetical protein